MIPLQISKIEKINNKQRFPDAISSHTQEYVRITIKDSVILSVIQKFYDVEVHLLAYSMLNRMLDDGCTTHQYCALMGT